MGLTEKLNQIKTGSQSLLDYANEITGESDVDLGDAVRTLADGYGQGGSSFNLAQYCTNRNGQGFSFQSTVIDAPDEEIHLYFPLVTNAYRMFYTSTFKCKKLIIDFPNATSLQGLCVGSNGSGFEVDEIVLKIPNSCTDLASMFSVNTNFIKINKLNIVGSTRNITKFYRSFPFLSLDTVNGGIDIIGDPIDFTSETGTINDNFPDFKYARFVPNTKKNSTEEFRNCTHMNDESFVSLINCLDINTEGKYCNLGIALQNRMNAIYGTVNENNLFVLDSSGSMTLMDFMTNVKGWSLS